VEFYYLAAFGCEKKENDFPYGTCVKGVVVGYEQCYNNVLIQVGDYNFGNKVTVSVINDQGHTVDYVEYENVIKAPANRIPDGLIYFIARKYKPDTDDSIVLCPQIIPYDVPLVVITDYSQTQCQQRFHQRGAMEN